MPADNPTASGGASITERIEALLTPIESAPQPNEATQNDQEDTGREAVEASEVAEEQPASDEQSGDDGPQISLTDLAKYLGVDESALDVDEDGGLKVKTKIDGKEGAAKFAELVKSYQLQGHVDAKAREAAEQAKALQSRMQEFEAYAQSEAQKFASLADIANKELMSELADVDWQTLARNDPAEYVAKQAEFTARQQRINQLNEAARQTQAQAQQAQEQRSAQLALSEAARLPTLIPEWADAKTAETEKKELATWLKTQGFTDRDLSGLVRADAVAMLRKAWLFDQGKAKVAVAEKKVRIAPKLVKPGQSVNATERASENVRGLKETIRKTGGKQGIVEYLIATGRA